MNTITETRKRLRAAAKAARDGARFPMNLRVEVGLRTIPVYTDHLPARGEWAAEGEDLIETIPLADAARDPQTRLDGYVAHLYFSTADQWGYGELVDVITVWTGTATEAAQVVHSPTEIVSKMDLI